jgi:uncharacterized phage-associated protein
MANVHDVAAYILERSGGGLSTMKLQKLAYYSQAWHLVWEEKPLFPEMIQAWQNGPVVYALYDKHRRRFQVDSWPDGSSANLTESEKGTINSVLDSYGKYSGQQLSELSHREGPWLSARGDIPSNWGSSVVIPLPSIQAYYSAVAADQTSTDI